MAIAVRRVSWQAAHAAGDGDDFSGDAGFLEAHGFFDGDFVEGVHAHLDVGQIDPCRPP
jgi:hypothetical protein